MPTPPFTGRDLNLLHSLHALLRERHVSRAAEQVGVTQSAMSKSFKRLRQRFHDPLLVRIDGAYQLTPRAQELLPPLEEAMTTLRNEVFERAEFDPERSHRTFKIAASSTTAFVALSPLIPHIAERYAGITFAILPMDRSADAMASERGADLVLLPSVLPTTLPRERLYDDDWVIVCSAESGYGSRLTTEQLAAAPRVVFEENGLRTHGELLLQSMMPDTARVIAPDFMTVLHLISGSPLIAVVQGRVARRLGAQNDLRIIDSPVALPGFGIDMVWSRPPHRDAGAAWLRRLLHDVIAEQGTPA